MNKTFKRRIAVLLTAAMAIGSTFTSFAAPDLTGEGMNAGDLWAEEIVKTVVPSTETLNQCFDFFVDPERLVNSAGVAYVTSGTSVITSKAIGNDNGVYFLSPEASGVTFGAISTAASLRVHNFKKCEISFEVGVKSGTASDFNLVDKATAQAQDQTGVVTTPALYLGVVATNASVAAWNTGAQAITKAGISYIDTFAAQSANYDIMDTASTGGAAKFGGAKYVAIEKADTGVESWSAFQFQIEGYVGKCNVKNNMVAPSLEFTWNIQVSEGPKITVDKTGLITVTDLTSFRNFSTSSIFTLYSEDGSSINLSDLVSNNLAQLNAESWDAEQGGSFTVKLSSAAVNALKGMKVWATTTLTDGSTIMSSKVLYE